MAIGLVGRKRGMTRIFTAAGSSVPVTVVEVTPNRVTRRTGGASEGYEAVQVAWGTKRRSLINKPLAGVLAAAEIESASGLAEFRLDAGEGRDLKPGSVLKVDIFADGQKVDVTGTTIGRGFAGVIRRHNFGGHRASHGASLTHRTPGSTGQRQTPGKVLKGLRMPGHMGNVSRTTQSLELVKVDAERNLLLIKGAVPGPKGGMVIVRPAKKSKRGKNG
ncbi:MAG: 50S ribosomal protein L3 [Gammaproteobacteria bacterium RIFCSPLOWO2_02_FULL_61_13]|nr:MAG: 50S ribosomal protein L3 [Gammaproteobacteria bacterium RIFCSPLOWO2_02_FULL_61_13]HLA41051.1 50S ribosomal protein L3 [Candidatus Glassbacteria bacterium]